MNKFFVSIALFVLGGYRLLVSPVKNIVFGLYGRCRYEPSCSCYAMDALRTHGAMRGSWLATKRFCRCHPWGGAGHDPVPATFRKLSA